MPIFELQKKSAHRIDRKKWLFLVLMNACVENSRVVYKNLYVFMPRVWHCDTYTYDRYGKMLFNTIERKKDTESDGWFVLVERSNDWIHCATNDECLHEWVYNKHIYVNTEYVYI